MAGQTPKAEARPLLRDDFIASDEWQKMLRILAEWKEHAMACMRSAGDFATSRYYAGHLDCIDAFVDLPEKALSDGEPKTKEAPEGVMELPNHPRPTKTLF